MGRSLPRLWHDDVVGVGGSRADDPGVGSQRRRVVSVRFVDSQCRRSGLVSGGWVRAEVVRVGRGGLDVVWVRGGGDPDVLVSYCWHV